MQDTRQSTAATNHAGSAVREFFTLREAEARASRVDDQVREELARALRRAIESRTGSEALWINGAPALAIRLAKESWSSAVETARRAAGSDGDLPLAEVLSRLGISDARRADLLTVDAQVSALLVPGSDGEVTAEHARALPRIDAALTVLTNAVAQQTLRPADFARARRTRIAYVVAVTAAMLAVVVMGLLIKHRTRVTASATYSIRYEPIRAIDGIEHTEWLLPDNTAGWLDVELGRRRAVKQVRLLNTHNDWFHDRATREYEIELWSGNRLVKKYAGAFDAFTPTPRPITVPVSSDGQMISRVRVQVKSWFMSGGGLAEVWVD